MNNEFHYSNERNAQIVIALLKANNIKKIVASPGSTNISFVGSVQNDSYFEVYSSVDERSAAYLACGLAAESDEPVVLSCTGATASRNYLSGLTEAYYRKLPIIAVTSTHEQSMVGNLIPQVIDRSACQNDVAIMSVQIPTVKDAKDDWNCQIKVNRALSAIKRNGGGPVHLNLETANVRQPFSVEELKDIKVIQRYTVYDELPEMPKGRIGIFVGSHKNWSKSLTESVDKFCEVHNAVVFCDHTSGYEGKYKIMAALLGSQDKYRPEVCRMDMYIRMYDDLVKGDNDNPTIGVLLCTDTDNTIAKYSVLHDSDQIFAAKYMTYMPTEEELRREIEQQKRFFMEQHEKEEE